MDKRFLLKFEEILWKVDEATAADILKKGSKIGTADAKKILENVGYKEVHIRVSKVVQQFRLKAIRNRHKIDEILTRRFPWHAKHTVEANFFLASLSENAPMGNEELAATRYKNNFRTLKTILAKKLFGIYNTHIFENALAYCVVLDANLPAGHAGSCSFTRDGAVIKLSTAYITNPERLRDVLIHEMCHAATWNIDKIADVEHGVHWQAWAQKANNMFRGLPEITEFHNYCI